MTMRTLTTWQEWLEADRLIATAFLDPWDEEKASEKVQAQAEGSKPRPEETWGLIAHDGTLEAAITTLERRMYVGGTAVGVGEAAMVGSRAESRGRGNVRTLMSEVLASFKKRGDVFAALIPFSCAFYRKFGFELTSNTLKQHLPIDQLAEMACTLPATHVEREEDLAAVRDVYDAFARSRNLARVRTDSDWHWRGNGEFGERGFGLDEFRHDTYVLWKGSQPCAYVTFAFKHEPGMPIFGELVVTDMAYDGPESFTALLGLLYRLRAKAGHVTLDLCDDIDLSVLVPEGNKVERTLQSYVMLRVLDVVRALELMELPPLDGSFVVEVDDAFMPENSGAYRMRIERGRAQVSPTDEAGDLRVSIQTLCLLVVGRIGLEEALLREGTQVLRERDLLTHVFRRRPIHLSL